MTDHAAKNKEIIRYFFEEVYNKGNYDVADTLVSPDYISHNKLQFEVIGPEGIKQAARIQRNAFPDLHTELLDLVAEADTVAVRGKDTGTFKNEFMGMPPTGNAFEITWIDIFRLENGKLAEAWLEIDGGDFRDQLTKKNL